MVGVIKQVNNRWDGMGKESFLLNYLLNFQAESGISSLFNCWEGREEGSLPEAAVPDLRIWLFKNKLQSSKTPW
jgi:hypothetical protein